MNNNTDNGGPAFPIATEHIQSIADQKCEDIYTMSRKLGTYPGMSLRDWFAGMSLSGFAANPSSSIACIALSGETNVSKASYKLADDMISARKETP